jgi:hypothetical protein
VTVDGEVKEDLRCDADGSLVRLSARHRDSLIESRIGRLQLGRARLAALANGCQADRLKLLEKRCRVADPRSGQHRQRSLAF